MLVAHVKNTPKVVNNGWVVARRDDHTGELWYYGTYEDRERAINIALELDNGIVLESVKL